MEDYIRPIIVAQVPITGYAGNSQLLETDEQGRELWSYETSRYLTYLICQKHDHEQVYYYEDFCFIIGNPSIGLSSTEINNLKVLNDWGLALDLSKSRSYGFDRYSPDYSWVTAQELIDGAMHEYGERAVDIQPVDHNQGKHLWLIRASTKEKPKFEETVFYFAIITKEGEKERISKLLALDDLYAYQTALHEFKLENGWSFSSAQFNE